MKRISLILLMFIILLILNSLQIKAQVTIGSGNPPSNGVLLDLKEIDDASTQNGGVTTNKGLLLPRVKLSNISNLNDIPNADIAIPKQYTGLFVYNIDSVNVNKGINVWDGAKWISFQTQSGEPKSELKSFLRARGGSGTIVADISLIGLNTWRKIPFGIKEFDENEEYNNLTTYEFIPKQKGIYNIYAQYKINGVLTAGDYSIGIIKRDSNSTTHTLIAEETSSVVSVLNLYIGSPTRSVQTLVALEAGDAIVIGVKTPLASIILLGSTHSYFTVHQVK
ncbi:hypothetical protein JGH11_18750 [Dysgonomonas sp. Marseille-P4677]|uniref:hypothetical protein n=1 Tax=Dysgonomonas sp. Marseille-P4677 TaxID=2364790 RepID=UPI001913028A|nr:hypothetical protein [Dysgonomonas sp. Marseille-P4677]MBK5722913.1 hypothetical protein [Dysgonomonas sp. Marseille-P4677]